MIRICEHSGKLDLLTHMGKSYMYISLQLGLLGKLFNDVARGMLPAKQRAAARPQYLYNTCSYAAPVALVCLIFLFKYL